MKIPTFLDEGRLDVSSSLSKITMKNNHVATLEPPLPCNSVIWLWSKITSSTFLHHQLLVYFALAKVAVVMVLGSMEYECCFSTLSFLKSKLWNWLTTHLDLCVCTKPLHFGYLSFWGCHQRLGK